MEYLYDFSKFSIDKSKGQRIFQELLDEHHYRNSFQRDRDRILHSKAFMRLYSKTQVFLAGDDDHVRSRLIHCLEVSQIARTISKALNINVDLAEAIALGHDIGHTPFGHIGERTLHKIMTGETKIKDVSENFKDYILSDQMGFKHNWQSIIIPTYLEDKLNLTHYTLWGFLHHSGLYFKNENESQVSYYYNFQINDNVKLYDLIKNYYSLEAIIVAIADEIAQRHHIIVDALEYKILNQQLIMDTVSIKTLKRYFSRSYSEHKNNQVNNEFIAKFNNEMTDILSELEDIVKDQNKDSDFRNVLSKYIVNFLTTDLIYNIAVYLNKYIENYNSIKDFKLSELKENIGFGKNVKRLDKIFDKILTNYILNSHKAQLMDGKGSYIIKKLFDAFASNPQQLPDKTVISLFKSIKVHKPNDVVLLRNLLRNIMKELYKIQETELEIEGVKIEKKEFINVLLRTICNYIAGMTDKYAISQHRFLYNID